MITGRRSQQGCAADVPEADLEESDARAKAEPSAGRRLRRLAQEESSKPDPKGGDDSQWKLQESLVQNSQHAAQQHRRQQDRSDPPGESISGAMSAVKQKETGDHREDGDGNRWPPQVPRNLGSSSYCRCDRADAPKGRNSRPAVGADAIRDLAQAGDGNRKEERCDFEQQKGLSSLGENPCALDQPGDAAEKRP